MVTDGFSHHGSSSQWDLQEDSPLDLGASDEAPPAYGELHDQLNLSQAGFNAGAAVTGTVLLYTTEQHTQATSVLKPPT